MAQAHRDYPERADHDFITFLRGMIIPSAKGPRVFEEVIQSFQLEFFYAIEPSLRALRDGTMPPISRFWVERTKKGSKDADVALCLLWLAAFSRKPLYLQVGAADRDQAAIVKRRMSALLYWNTWLERHVTVQAWKVKSTRRGGAEVDIVAADIAGSHGETPDLLFVNELSHVTKWEFIENLMDNADGVAQGIVIVATNAGFKGTKAEVLRNNALNSDNWGTYILHKPAPWTTSKNLKEAKMRNVVSRYRRLWWGQWASGKGDALDEGDIDRCFRAGITEHEKSRKGWLYVGGLDLGISHDHAGFVVLGVNKELEEIHTAFFRGWAPRKGGEVDLLDVEDTCLRIHKVFRLRHLMYDPAAGGSFMAQRLTRKLVPMREMTFGSSKNLTLMAQTFIQSIEAGVLKCYDDGEGTLRRDFGKFNIKERATGYKLEAVSDEFGHADVGTALVICLPKAVELLEVDSRRLQPEDVIAGEDDLKPLTPKEVKAMHPELRELYEMAGEASKRRRYIGFREEED
jgi:phage terminase large subunit-like protein